MDPQATPLIVIGPVLRELLFPVDRPGYYGVYPFARVALTPDEPNFTDVDLLASLRLASSGIMLPTTLFDVFSIYCAIGELTGAHHRDQVLVSHDMFDAFAGPHPALYSRGPSVVRDISFDSIGNVKAKFMYRKLPNPQQLSTVDVLNDATPPYIYRYDQPFEEGGIVGFTDCNELLKLNYHTDAEAAAIIADYLRDPIVIGSGITFNNISQIAEDEGSWVWYINRMVRDYDPRNGPILDYYRRGAYQERESGVRQQGSSSRDV